MNYTPTMIITLIICVIIAYLMGSLNFAIIFTKAFAHDDIRKHGSGNAGFTNVLRTLGKAPAFLTLGGDFLKGIVAVLIGRLLLSLFAGINDFSIFDFFIMYGTLLGHIFPLYYGFKGGKGILTSFGMLMVITPYVGIFCFVGFLICVIFTRFVSLGSIIACMLLPIGIIALNMILYSSFPLTEFLLSLPISIIIIYMHRANIKRLLSGTENKISFKKK